MAQYIDKSDVAAEIEKRKRQNILNESAFEEDVDILSFLDTLEVKEVDLTDRKTDWSPSKKQMESLKDLLEYNIGVFDYQKFVEVKSLYDDLTKIFS